MKLLKPLTALLILFNISLMYGCTQPVSVPKAEDNGASDVTPVVSQIPVFEEREEGVLPLDNGDYADVPLPIKLSKKENKKIEPEKVVFLTFDDGPSALTPQFLDVLKSNGVQATFCVIGNRAEAYPDIIKRAYAEGNAIINHSYDHNPYNIYVTSETFMDSIEKCNMFIDSIIERTSIEKSFIRFPGGSHIPFVIDHRDKLMPPLASKGFNTLDWNVSSGDCDTGLATADYITNNVNRGIGISTAVILMHDFKYRATTLEALTGIIKNYKDNGYVFRTIRDITKEDIENLKAKKVINMMY